MCNCISKSPLSLSLSVPYVGTAPPFAPVSVSIDSIGAQSVTISWLVPVISYDPESYAIHYGLKETGMNYSTESLPGTEDFWVRNQSYITKLPGLQPDTSYHITVIAINSNGSTASETLYFTTPPPCEFHTFPNKKYIPK